MILRLKDPRFMIRIGLVSLALANLGHWLLPRTGYLQSGPIDGVFGFLIGVSIACLLLGVWKGRRSPKGG